MIALTTRHAFIVFYLVLGVVLLLQSAAAATAAAHANPHVLILATLEAIGALLFMTPRTIRVGGWILLITVGIAVFAHAARGEFAGQLLVYATATFFVMVHGSPWRQHTLQPP